jgi:pimeloyl-ACP methyl ester carboxylesterase
MLFPVGLIPAAAERTPAIPGLRTFRLPLADGEVDAWFLPPGLEGPRPALLFTHGNAELIDDWVDALRSFARRGVGVMLVEYPGYGRSGGTPSYRSIRAAALAAYDELVRQPEVDPARVVAYGRSLGAGASAVLAQERPLAAMVLLSAFTTPRAFARRYLLPGFLVRDRFEVLQAVTAFRGPVLVVHGERDEVIPFAHGRALAAAGVDAILIAHDCAHNDCPPDWEQHVEQVLRFLAAKGVLP